MEPEFQIPGCKDGDQARFRDYNINANRFIEIREPMQAKTRKPVANASGHTFIFNRQITPARRCGGTKRWREGPIFTS